MQQIPAQLPILRKTSVAHENMPISSNDMVWGLNKDESAPYACKPASSSGLATTGGHAGIKARYNGVVQTLIQEGSRGVQEYPFFREREQAEQDAGR